jgi:phage terminase small subunit
MTRRPPRGTRIGLRYRPLPIEPPAALTGRARELWTRIAPELADEGTHTSVDVPILTDYCVVVAELECAYRFEQEIGLERAVRLGFSRIRSQLTNTMIRLSDRLGLNPLARRKIRRHLFGEQKAGGGA